MINEILHSLGSWSIQLKDETPDEVLGQLGFFGHVAVVRGPVDVAATSPYLLSAARYVGVLLERSKDRRTLTGDGMVFWLGDSDNKGKVLEAAVNLNAATLTDAVTAVLPPAVRAGTINTKAGTYTGKHQFETPREVLDKICDAFNVEYRVKGDATIDVGTQAQLYRSTPTTIVAAKNTGADLDLTSLGADFDVDESVRDYSTRVLLLGSKTEGENEVTFATGSADAPSVPYLDPHGNTLQITRPISESGTAEGSVTARAQLQLNRFNRTAVALKVTAQDYEISGPFNVGDNAYVYDPANGIVDTARSIDFRGELIHPDVVRITGASWPVTADHTVAFRTQSGAWIDLTPWVVFESGGGDITVGDLPRSLTGGTTNPMIDRLDSLPDNTTPGPPTDLALSTTAVVEPTGQLSAIIRASWTAPATNTDGSVITDLSHYRVEWRMVAPGMVWQSTTVADTTVDLSGLVVDYDYEVRVAAVDRSLRTSAYTVTLGIHTAVDDIPPPAPSDPVVSNYLGQLRISWDGKDNVGAAQPPDFNRVDVHVSATTGFTPSATTLVASLSTSGVAYATAPYGATQYVKLVAYDTAGNPSATSGQVSGSTAQVVSADVFNGAIGSAKLADLAVITAKIDDLAVNDAKIGNLSVGKLAAGTMTADVTISGQFATALTGARVAMNSLGVQKWDASNNLLVSLTGTQSLITGQIQTALSGQRLIMNQGGSNPSRLDFYATSGNEFASIEAVTVSNQAAVTISANNTAANGESGVLLVRRSFAHMFYGPKDLSGTPQGIYVDFGTVRTNSQIIDLQITPGLNTPGGARIAMGLKGNNATQLNVWNTASSEPWISAVNQDAGLVFSTSVPAGYNARVYAVGADPGAKRDLYCASMLYEGSLMAVSSGKLKAEVTDLALDMRAATRGAKAKRYRMPHRAEAPYRNSDGDMVGQTREAPQQIGLIAEDLPADLQRIIPNGPGGKDALGYDMSGLVAAVWDGLGQALAEIDELRARLPDPPAP